MIDDSDVFSIQPDRNNPNRILAAACSGIYRSLNGGETWTKLSSKEEVSYRTYVVVQDPEYEKTWFAGTAHGLLRSDDGGTNWVKLGSFSTRSVAFDPTRLGRVFIATDGEGILRSDDSGKTWQAVNQGFSNVRVSSAWSELGELYILVDSLAIGGVYRLKGPPDSWEKIEPEPEDPVALESKLSMEPADAVTESRANRRLSAMYLGSLSDNRDGNKLIYPALGSTVSGVIWTRGDVLLAATSSGLRASSDRGRSWRSVPGEMRDDTLQAICRHPDKRDEIFAAKYGAVYASFDAGRSWRKISPEGWPISSIKELAVVTQETDRLIVFTQQQGVWEFFLERNGVSARTSGR
jgi:photosystem II stability/assembly factor-like uncharacterized protein